MTPKTGATNGVAKTPETGNPQKPELSKVSVSAPEKKEPKVLTIQEKLKKLEKLNQLLERRKLLVEGLDNVNQFVTSPNSQSTIRFTDARSTSFSISSSAVIADTVEFIKRKLETELETVKSKIVLD